GSLTTTLVEAEGNPRRRRWRRHVSLSLPGAHRRFRLIDGEAGEHHDVPCDDTEDGDGDDRRLIWRCVGLDWTPRLERLVGRTLSRAAVPWRFCERGDHRRQL